MSRAVGDLQTQWQAVRAAPLLYIAATAAIILLVWTILHFLYRHRIDGLKEDLGREERECGRLRHKLDELIASNAGEAPRFRQESTPPSPRLIGDPPTGPRVYVPGDVSPSSLRAIFAGKTALEGGLNFAQYVGKWMQFSGTVYDVECDKDLGWSVVLDDDPDAVVQQTILYLAETEGAKAELLKKGTFVSGVGNIAKCDKYTLSLQYCVLN